MFLRDHLDDAPGTVRSRHEVPTPAAYAVFDCETTGTTPEVDEIVSFAAIRLDPEGVETGRFTRLVRPSQPIPPEATAVHGIGDEDVASAPCFAEIAPELLELIAGAVFVAHNARFDLAMLQHAFARAGVKYQPAGVACTLDAFRLLEPLALDHRLESICQRRGIPLVDAHDATSDVSATAVLLRGLLEEGIAPETMRLDHDAFMRLRSRGDTRPATAAQIRRVFALGYAAGLSRDGIVEVVSLVAGTTDVDELTREQIQDVYDALERSTPPPIERAA
jgi:DNA polymerase III epsilon subunit family exonuclease